MSNADFKINNRGEHHLILSAAIQKAIDGGWDYESFGSVDHWLRSNASIKSKAETVYAHVSDKVYQLIFNHDFAKALWGTKMRDGMRQRLGSWQYTDAQLPDYLVHLQQMVIAEDPIAYLGANI